MPSDFRNPFFVLYNKDLDLYLKEVHSDSGRIEMSHFWSDSAGGKKVINIHNRNALNVFFRYLAGELRPDELVELSWTQADSFIKGHYRWSDMVIVPVYKDRIPNFYEAMEVA
jgi:hypothetical protein